MFVYTAKVTRRKAAVGFLVLGLALCSVISMFTFSENPTYDGDAVMDAMYADESVAKTLQTEQERIDFLKNLGWEIAEKTSSSAEVIIPPDFDDVYEAYNTMQKENGFDLSRYKGKQATLYTYVITNHPSGEQEVYANLLICKNKIIGGDICSKNVDGFMHGVCNRENAAKNGGKA